MIEEDMYKYIYDIGNLTEHVIRLLRYVRRNAMHDYGKDVVVYERMAHEGLVYQLALIDSDLCRIKKFMLKNKEFLLSGGGKR